MSKTNSSVSKISFDHEQIRIVVPEPWEPFSAEGWSRLGLIALSLLLIALVAPWLMIGRKSAIVRNSVHLCGVSDFAPEATRPETERLYETPEAVLDDRRQTSRRQPASGGGKASPISPAHNFTRAHDSKAL